MDQAPSHKAQLEAIDREQRRKAADDEDLVQVLGLLIKHPGFKRYQDLLNSQLTVRGSFLLEPLPSLDSIPSSEHNKGTMYGLTLARDLPSSIIAVAQETRQDVEEDE